MTITKVMKAATLEDPATLKFPVAVCPKIDGIRGVINDDKVVLSLAFKPIRNKFIQKILHEIVEPDMDGELLAGKTFQACNSGIMSFDGEPDFTYNIFDWARDGLLVQYRYRMAFLKEWYEALPPEFRKYISIVDYEIVNNLEEFYAAEERYLNLGYEGIMIRSIPGVYKCGRSTLREGLLLKYKRFVDSEAEVIGFEELYKNENEAGEDNFGNIKRSQSKEGLVPAGTLGSFLVRDLTSGVEFTVGSGFDPGQRQLYWDNQQKYLGKIVKYHYFPKGIKDKPRFPIFDGFRDKDDM